MGGIDIVHFDGTDLTQVAAAPTPAANTTSPPITPNNSDKQITLRIILTVYVSGLPRSGMLTRTCAYLQLLLPQDRPLSFTSGGGVGGLPRKSVGLGRYDLHAHNTSPRVSPAPPPMKLN
jgi:hypothetical protein